MFRANPIDELRDSFDFLFYDTINLKDRFYECARLVRPTKCRGGQGVRLLPSLPARTGYAGCLEL